MRRLLPAFVQRRLLLSAARRALSAGRPEAALEILRDELLAHDPRAESLRTVLLPLIPTPPVPPKLDPSAVQANPSGRSELRDLLKQMRAQHPPEAASSSGIAQVSPAREGAPATPLVAGAAGTAGGAGAKARARPLRLRMSLDDAGSFLVCAGQQVLVGHSRAGEADLPILADLLPRHARFTLEPASFHAGSRWSVEAIGAAQVRVGERALSAAPQSLESGDRVRLGEHTTLRFEQPDSASHSCTLVLEGASEAAGAQQVLLFAPGAEGRIRIGPRSSRHVQAALGGVELELVHDGAKLHLHCESGLIPDADQGSPPRTEYELPLLLARPLHLRLCMPTPSERPRWISFAPLEDA